MIWIFSLIFIVTMSWGLLWVGGPLKKKYRSRIGMVLIGIGMLSLIGLGVTINQENRLAIERHPDAYVCFDGVCDTFKHASIYGLKSDGTLNVKVSDATHSLICKKECTIKILEK